MLAGWIQKDHHLNSVFPPIVGTNVGQDAAHRSVVDLTADAEEDLDFRLKKNDPTFPWKKRSRWCQKTGTFFLDDRHFFTPRIQPQCREVSKVAPNLVIVNAFWAMFGSFRHFHRRKVS